VSNTPCATLVACYIVSPWMATVLLPNARSSGSDGHSNNRFLKRVGPVIYLPEGRSLCAYLVSLYGKCADSS